MREQTKIFIFSVVVSAIVATIFAFSLHQIGHATGWLVHCVPFIFFKNHS